MRSCLLTFGQSAKDFSLLEPLIKTIPFISFKKFFSFYFIYQNLPTSLTCLLILLYTHKSMYIYTYTLQLCHTHPYRYACSHMHTYPCRYACTHTYVYTTAMPTHTHTDMLVPLCIKIHTHYSYTYTSHTHPYRYACTHVHMHTYTYTLQLCPHTPIQISLYSCAYTYIYSLPISIHTHTDMLVPTYIVIIMLRRQYGSPWPSPTTHLYCL